MAILLTGGTGYIGGYVVARLLEATREPLLLLARKATREGLWRALQLHLDAPAFGKALRDGRIRGVAGDLTAPNLGLDHGALQALAKETDSILHIAASLNRKSERACLNTNLRGTLHVIEVARRAHDDHGLRRISHVSTVAVAGERQDEVVREDTAIDWERADYDPYARTKKFCEYMITRLLPEVPRTIFRPSVVLGDSRRPETTQFDMAKAFVFLARLPFLPLRATDRIDIVPVDYVADAIATIHLREPAPHSIYHLASGEDAPTYAEVTAAVAEARKKSPPWFWPWAERPFAGTARFLAGFRGTGVGSAAARLQVFMPYLTYNTVFDNARVVGALGRKPARFPEYCARLLTWCLAHKFEYPYVDLPADPLSSPEPSR
ncbi:MAG TPA: SDR family oxidoreductase [Planctomycetota bacterium]|nr:SDR family oxidoreductase [Planctomycetota bacterium]